MMVPNFQVESIPDSAVCPISTDIGHLPVLVTTTRLRPESKSKYFYEAQTELIRLKGC